LVAACRAEWAAADSAEGVLEAVDSAEAAASAAAEEVSVAAVRRGDGEMSLARLFRHLMSPHWRVRRSFAQRTLASIEQAIARSETRHGGQIRFAVEHALDTGSLLRGLSARERALDVFSALKVWDTEHNNGVLIYLLLADRDVEIIADRGVDARVGAQGWETICREMESAFRGGNFEQGVLGGIERVSSLLAAHYPRDQRGRNELPDRPVVL
jgi:uncharacterized membrane protein